MPRAKGIPDSAFIPLIRQGLSPVRIADALGLSPHSHHARLKRICREIGVTYESLRTSNFVSEAEQERERFIIHDRQRVVSLTITDGVIMTGSDPHWARLDNISTAHKGFCNVIADLGSVVRAVILNGDLPDFAAPSRFPRGPWRNPAKPLIKDELEAVQQRSSEILAAAPKKAAKVRTLGNHCDRFEAKLSAAMPELEGLPGTRLRDHIPEWVEAERIDVNPDSPQRAEWIHNIKGGEVGRDRQNIFTTGHHTFVGHNHQLHTYPHTWRRGTYYATCCGTMAELDDDAFHYLGSRPANWQSGFVVSTWVDGTMLYPELAEVKETKSGSGRLLWFRGKRYA